MTRIERVLFCYRDDVDESGGAATVMNRTAAALREVGIAVDVSRELRPDPDGYDLAHAFNLWQPHTALEQLRHLRATGVPVAWLPFHLGWSELTWAARVVPQLLDPTRPEEARRQALELLADGRIEIDGCARWTPNEPVAGFGAQLDEMVGCIDHVCCISHHEARALAEATRWSTKPWTLTPHGVDAATFANADPRLFREQFGLEDFVLCVGAVDRRKNQLLLVEALRGLGLTTVLLGPCFEPDYLELILERGGSEILHVERVPPTLVASALAGAAVHVLPSFAEGAALANLEAAVAGCPMVVSNRSSELEYFGDAPAFCDPCDVGSIRRAVREVAGTRGERRWSELADHVASTYTWERTAAATLTAYERLLRAREASLQLDGVRSFAAVALAEDVVAHPDLLAAWDGAFSAADDATLVIYGRGWNTAQLERELLASAGRAGLDTERCADMIALAGPAADERPLARIVSAVVGFQLADGPLATLPAFEAGAISNLRRLAEERWAATASA